MKKILLSAASLISLCNSMAFAQEGKSDQSNKSGLEVVIVTAQKKQTQLQKTPISISVIGSKALENQHVQSLEDLMNGGTPSLRIAPFFSRSSALTVGIRGMVPFDANQPSRDATVGVYLDGVYLGRSHGLGAALYDVQRIEVLKGPQGTLFGRNTEGGALSIVSKKPSGKLKLNATIGGSNFGGENAEIHFDLPKAGGISAKFDAVYRKRGGTVENPLSTSEDFNQFYKHGVHAAFLFELSNEFSAQLDLDSSYDATTPYYLQLVEHNPNAATPLSPLVKVQPNRTEIADIGLLQEWNIGHNKGYAFRTNFKPSENFELKTISSWRQLSQDQRDNSIGAHASPWRANGGFARYSMASIRQTQYSHELQLIGDLNSISYVGGLYYYHEEGDDDAWTPNTARWNLDGTAFTYLPDLPSGAAWPFPDRASTAKATSLAAFGQFTYSPEFLSNKGHLTIGGRFTHDEKSGKLYKVNGADVNYTFDINSDHFDPMVTMAYDFTDDIHSYLKWGTAYRAGGANSRSVNYRTFDSESVSTIELGAKSELWNNRLRANIAVFSTDYKDIQVDFSASNLLNSNRGTLETVNGQGTGKIEGVEIDLSAYLMEGLSASLSYAYTKGDFPKAANPFNNNALSNLFMVFTPENAISASIDYEKGLSFGKFTAHLDANAADGYRPSSSEDVFTDDSFILNGRIALSEIKLNEMAKGTIALWSRNLLDEEHKFYVSRGSFAFIGAFGMFNEPRTWGVDFNVKY